MYAGSDSATAMVFGPYDNTFGQGHHTAQFTLMVDNNSGSDVVATLDVVTGYGGNMLAHIPACARFSICGEGPGQSWLVRPVARRDGQ